MICKAKSHEKHLKLVLASNMLQLIKTSWIYQGKCQFRHFILCPYYTFADWDLKRKTQKLGPNNSYVIFGSKGGQKRR